MKSSLAAFYFFMLASLSIAAPNTYISKVDKEVTIHRIAVLPASDNVNGIFARAVENRFKQLAGSTSRFDLVEVKDVDLTATQEAYENDPSLIQSIVNKYKVDGLFIEGVNRNSTHTDLTLDLFLSSDGMLFVQETASLGSHADLSEIEKKTDNLYAGALKKIPYHGLVMSRQGNRVTINMGAKDGLKEDMIVSVEQIIDLKRHPKFHFILSSEKEVLGRIRIVKADDTLSFGVVVQEKEKGVITVDSKITSLDFVSYGANQDAGPDSLDPGPKKYLPKDSVSFGKDPKEWLPHRNPSMGKVDLALGLGSLIDSLVTSNGNFTTTAPFYPQLILGGEVWITPNWLVGGQLKQGVMSLANPQSGSSPGSLNTSSTSYDLSVGYKFLLLDDFFGPQVNTHLGYSKYSLFVDASTPLTYSSTTYGGLFAGIGGSTPINFERAIYVDANLDYFLSPSLTETPIASAASSSASIVRFSIGANFKLATPFWVTAHVNFEFYSAKFSGTGGRSDPGVSTNQTLTTFVTGMEYLF